MVAIEIVEKQETPKSIGISSLGFRVAFPNPLDEFRVFEFPSLFSQANLAAIRWLHRVDDSTHTTQAKCKYADVSLFRHQTNPKSLPISYQRTSIYPNHDSGENNA